MAKEYNIARTPGPCSACGKTLAAGEELVATVRQAGEELQREDYCPACWQGASSQDRPDRLAVWRTRVPRSEEKKRLFVDNEVLVNFFQRLDGAEEPAKVSFRFVLALVLMRKKLLVYQGAEKAPDGREFWNMRLKATEEVFQVLDPHMDAERIAEVSQELGAILEADL